MKTSSHLLRTIHFVSLGALVVFTGCANVPLRHSTLESDYASPPAIAGIGGQLFEAPMPLNVVQPEYPYRLKSLGIAGLVILNCEIDKTGKVTDVRIESSTYPGLEQPALDALKQWTFKAATQAGIPVTARVNIPITFALED
jgi:TonB family protein